MSASFETILEGTGVHLGSLLETLTEGLVVADLRARTTHWNRAALTMHGYASMADVESAQRDLDANFHLETLTGERVPTDRLPFMRLIAGESVEGLELCLVRPDGVRVFRYGGTVVRGSDGAAVVAMLHITDITQHQRVVVERDARHERERLLRVCSEILARPGLVGAQPTGLIADAVAPHLKADLVLHYRVVPGQERLELVFGRGIPPALEERARQLSIGDNFCGAVAARGQAIVADAERIDTEVGGALLKEAGARAYVGFPLRGQDGRVLGVLSFASARRDQYEEGERAFVETLCHMMVVAIEREESARAVLERERRLRLLLEQVSAMIWTTDTDPAMRITSAAGKIIERFGVDGSAVVGRTVAEILPAEAELSLAHHAEALRGESVTYDRVVAGRVLRSTIMPNHDTSGALIGTIGLAIDVTELVEADRARDEAAANMADAQRIGMVGSWEIRFDAQGKPMDSHYWSDENFRIYGYEPGSVQPTTDLVLERCHPEDRASIPRGVPEGSDTHQVEYRIVRPDGEVRHVQGRTHFYRDPSTRRLTRVVGTTHDITERMRAKAELVRLNAELEQRVVERTAELTAANTELEGFSYAVSHDLRAPLRAMSGFSRALLEDYGPLLPSEAKTYLDHIILGSKKMADLIEGLLHLARLTRGELRRDRVDLSAMATELALVQARAEPARQVEMSVESGLTVRGDERLLRAVMQNLLGNAWKYTSATAHPRVSVFSSVRDGERFVCVRDNGAGFDMKYGEKLFRPFSRLHRETEFPGLGIGLATVQRVVLRHGGSVFAEGVPNGGAVFGFSLPGVAGPSELG